MEDKKSQRIKAIEARRALTSEQRADFSGSVCKRISELPCFTESKTILAYAASYDEVDMAQLCSLAESLGKRVAYPVSYKGGIMEAYIPNDKDAWIVGKYDLRTPDVERSVLVDPSEIDLVIVPLVAFDEEKRRLGHGAGYYDRYLPKCTKSSFVAAAFEAQKLEHIVTDSHDMPMSAIVTEDSVY